LVVGVPDGLGAAAGTDFGEEVIMRIADSHMNRHP